ncbi:hypothetical protein MXL46_20255 [Heyndrickxia sporothermodurans]|uniref:Uncharacterized protein n=2 Tax=Heyndrickxia TaxID=2837504 RepID=A0AB37HNJ7_9BACI|nr:MULTISPECIES: hypothetical protein [Heyndrickxia]MBL5768343.1 hypothetical protein [Heyndrickxia sporothermodurans]MBL5771982.1 hypothetical protein [Heyndrickxia sporothermodurans]MBL5775590.1 hypothetical protein [Heyndrickxia sporothermodurans]MBL5779133.1 hypothetical protein [Heyndrickxia sporothermodurans]MBL5783301.1 hypothetical protein [Heyndrickxia sporothermodurans]
MEGFVFNFKNKRVRVWFLTVLPAIILAILLYTLLPIKYNVIPMLFLIAAVMIYYSWVFIDKKKQRKDDTFLN